MKVVLTRKEISQIIVNHLVLKGVLRDNEEPVSVTYNIDGGETKNLTITIEEINE